MTDEFRPANVLKCKFENICRRAQKKKSQNVKQQAVTGGGKAVLSEYVSADESSSSLG